VMATWRSGGASARDERFPSKAKIRITDRNASSVFMWTPKRVPDSCNLAWISILLFEFGKLRQTRVMLWLSRQKVQDTSGKYAWESSSGGLRLLRVERERRDALFTCTISVPTDSLFA
jgi:hypothetical protein